MNADFSGLIEMSLVFGCVLLLAVAELIFLRRARRREDLQTPQRGTDSDKS